MANTIADLDAAIQAAATQIQSAKTQVTGYVADVTTAFNSLQQKIATLQAQVGSGAPIDTAPEIAAIQSALQGLTDLTTAVSSADAAAKIEAQ